MAEPLTSDGPQERPATHGKRATGVAAALILIVTVGLVLQSWFQMRDRAQAPREAPREFTPVEPATRADFLARQAEAQRQLSFEQAQAEEAARKQQLRERLEATGERRAAGRAGEGAVPGRLRSVHARGDHARAQGPPGSVAPSGPSRAVQP